MAAYRFWFPPLAPQDPRTWFRADALLIGCVFALEPRIPKMPAVAFWTALGAVGACARFAPSGPPLWESALIGWMIYTTAQGGIQIAQKVLNWEPLAALGVMSYSLYVWQTPLSGIPHRTFLGMAGAIVILAAFTILSHNYIEQPARRFGLKVLAGRSATTGVVAPPKVKLPEAVHVSQSRVMSG